LKLCGMKFSSSSSSSGSRANHRLAVLEQQLQHPVLYAPTGQSAAGLAQLQRQHTASTSASSGMFAGKVVVITGAAKGIGEAAALAFAKEGAQLLITDLDASAAEDAVARCRAAGSPKAVALAGTPACCLRSPVLADLLGHS
jgi:3-oxoacyl-ACP reductase-like protein